jgi:hypothetical protein
VLCWTFVLSFVAVIVGVLALIFGLIGAGRARRGEATNRGVALGGLWTGAGATAIALVLTVLFVVWTVRLTPVESQAGAAYLAEAGEEVVFADGLVVTVRSPERHSDARVYTVNVRVANDGDSAADVARAGFRATLDGTRVDPEDVWLAGSPPDDLVAGETAVLVYRMELPSPMGDYLSVDFAPGNGYEFGFWDLAMPGGGSGNDSGGDEGGGESGGVDV